MTTAGTTTDGVALAGTYATMDRGSVAIGGGGPSGWHNWRWRGAHLRGPYHVGGRGEFPAGRTGVGPGGGGAGLHSAEAGRPVLTGQFFPPVEFRP
jgi:hypothetical protein